MSQQEHPQIPQRPPPNVRTQQQNVPPRYQPELQIHQHQYRQQFLVGTSMFGINLLEMQHIFTTVFATITYTPLSLWLAMAFAIGGLITCVPAVICWFGLLICAVIGTGISLFIVTDFGTIV
ncbi:hypothetical protein G9A89_023774 [Geosiphon pyriformis]|nr:hypothetical protein G9A89_023774 [Geosiphon pyriformis]